ncbi:unnamed protein product [Macrosiphum euphorbiae]|uniref:Transposable element P transposase n=1 Tax=Macrosiphum euphorbiae TaxID=13131 RepID=A0AAV0WP17_9HEMI|nr:unnamed protein product [Macrosiphum euphorbiae]
MIKKKWIDNEESRFEYKFKNILSKIFTPTQTELLLRLKKVYKWSPEDIASAITIRSVSPKAYRYLREKKNFPLPGMSTLRNWASTFSIEPGLLKNVMILLKAKGDTMSVNEKLTMISFDETYVSNKICYDKKSEQIYGPAKCVQAVVLRGLVGSWKQPIYFDFDTPMSKELLLHIISEVHNIGFKVVAMVSDMGPSNMGLWRDLGICTENTWFKGFVLSDGKLIGKNILKEILRINKDQDFQVAYKLSEKHINVQGTARMNVKLAAHVFSNSVSKAILFCGEKNLINDCNWKEASEVIQLINDWFDLMNTQQKYDNHVASYGLNENEQNELLSKMNNFILQMRVYGKNVLLPFQKGIIVTNKSVQNLLEDLKDFGLSYIMTRKLNQDMVENLFSYLKGMAGSAMNNISPIDFKYW